MLRALDSTWPGLDERRGVVRVAGRLKLLAAIESLAHIALNETHDGLRADAIEALTAIGDRRATVFLSVPLTGDSRLKAQWAMEALVGLVGQVEAASIARVATLMGVAATADSAAQVAKALRPTLVNIAAQSVDPPRPERGPCMSGRRPTCTTCGQELSGGESIARQEGAFPASSPETIAAYALYDGTICFNCRLLRCPRCAGDPLDRCRKCGGVTEPAYRRHIDRLLA